MQCPLSLLATSVRIELYPRCKVPKSYAMPRVRQLHVKSSGRFVSGPPEMARMRCNHRFRTSNLSSQPLISVASILQHRLHRNGVQNLEPCGETSSTYRIDKARRHGSVPSLPADRAAETLQRRCRARSAPRSRSKVRRGRSANHSRWARDGMTSYTRSSPTSLP